MVAPLLGHFFPDLLVAGVFIVFSTIFIALVAKLLVLRFALGMPSGRAIFADLVMNTASTVLTFIPLASLGLMSGVTIDVNPAGWPILCAMVLFVATLIEWLIVRFGFRVPREKRPFGWLFLGNLPSVSVACISLVLFPNGPRTGPEHVFQLEKAPEFLTEELALQKVREAFAADGYDIRHWHPSANDWIGHQTKAPDGTQDKYMERTLANPNNARVCVAASSEADIRFLEQRRHARSVTYWVRLEGNRVICFRYSGL